MSEARGEDAALIALLRSRAKRKSWGRIATDVLDEGSALRLLDSGSGDALFPEPVDESVLRAARDDVRSWDAEGLHLTTVLDDLYPSRLRDIRETPPFLFYEGTILREDEGMSIVGSRDSSPWGISLAEDVAAFLVDEGLTVVSGLAAGIDAAAHRVALDNGGRTVAFLGTGIRRSYPASNAALQQEIGERGLLLSQFFPDAPPTKKSFPMRNASMSGYGLATIVIEAGEYSGTRIQARLAGEHGRPVILTSRVAETTSWGRALTDSANVHVAHSLGELKSAIREIRQAPADLENALRALTSA